MSKAKANANASVTSSNNNDMAGTVPQPRAKRPPAVHFEMETYYSPDKRRAISLPVRPEQLEKAGSDKFRDILKKTVMDLEETNHNTIVIYHREQEWWQIGGNSLLFYKYYLQDEYELTNIIPRRDNDHGCRWPANYDVGMIKSLDNFRNSMRKSNAETIFDTPELCIFRITKSFSDADITAFHNVKAGKLARINTLLTPKVAHPHIKQSIDNLTTFVVHHAEKMSSCSREIYCYKGVESLLSISYRFYLMSDGDISEEEYYTHALQQLRYFMAWLAFTQKFNIFTIDELVRLANDAVDLKERFQNELQKVRNKS